MRVKVSVIMPCFNAADYLGTAIRSIMAQSLKDIELIIVDDGSNDASMTIAKNNKEPRIRILKQPENCGYPTCMNKGIEIAQGEFIARMDADDISSPVRLEKQLSLLIQDKNLVFVGTRFGDITPRDRICGFPPDPKGTLLSEDWQAVYKNTRRFADASVMMRRDDLLAVGGYRTYQRTGQDVDLWLRLLELRDYAGTIDEVLYFRRLHVSTLSYSKNTISANRIPRILAQERKTCGTDQVGRGEFSEENYSAADDVSSLARKHYLGLWRTAAMCLEAGDVTLSVQLVRRATVAGGTANNVLLGLNTYIRHIARFYLARNRLDPGGLVGKDLKTTLSL